MIHRGRGHERLRSTGRKAAKFTPTRRGRKRRPAPSRRSACASLNGQRVVAAAPCVAEPGDGDVADDEPCLHPPIARRRHPVVDRVRDAPTSAAGSVDADSVAASAGWPLKRGDIGEPVPSRWPARRQWSASPWIASSGTCDRASLARGRRDCLDVGFRTALHDADRGECRQRGAAGESRVDDCGAHETGIAQAERRGERAACRHADDNDARADRRGASGAPSGSSRRRSPFLRARATVAPIEPVPAPPCVRRLALPRQQHEPAVRIGNGGDARALGEFLRRLSAAVAEHDERRRASTTTSPRERRGGTRAAAGATGSVESQPRNAKRDPFVQWPADGARRNSRRKTDATCDLKLTSEGSGGAAPLD